MIASPQPAQAPRSHRLRITDLLLHPGFITFVAGSFIFVFITWFVLVVAPIAKVEAMYRIQSGMRNVFGTTKFSQIFMPNISIDLRGYESQYRDNAITIPAVFVDEPVVYNVDPNNPDQYLPALKKGIAHASGTAFPDSGGLGYYFAHSSSPELKTRYNAVFYLLGKLKPGDTVFLWHEGKRFEYAVAWTTETTPEDVSFLHQHYDKETIVLQTCWPPGTNQRRFLVFAQRVAEKSAP